MQIFVFPKRRMSVCTLRHTRALRQTFVVLQSIREEDSPSPKCADDVRKSLAFSLGTPAESNKKNDLIYPHTNRLREFGLTINHWLFSYHRNVSQESRREVKCAQNPSSNDPNFCAELRKQSKISRTCIWDAKRGNSLGSIQVRGMNP